MTAVPQGMTAMLMQKLGASVVVLPGGEVYSALDKGVINTSDWASPSMNQRMGFYQVAKYTIIRASTPCHWVVSPST